VRSYAGDCMCTVTFIPIGDGYLLGMNRDEKIARGAGDPPEVRRFQRTRAIFPSENGVGMWIASNCYGITLALLNWNVPMVVPSHRNSRGLIIPRLLSSTSSAELNHALATQQVANCAPFRLVAVIPGERNVAQWSWNGTHFVRKTFPWDLRHWFSSSASDSCAEELRGRVCRRASNDRNAGSVGWLRHLHRSHENGPGAFSVCVHREEAETLSYTEICCTPGQVAMVHAIGSPCHPRKIYTIEVRRLYGRELTATPSAKQRIEETDVCRA
jgi:hypothetical protein